MKDTNKQMKTLRQGFEKLEAEKSQFEQEKLRVHDLNASSSDLLTLDIGGQ